MTVEGTENSGDVGYETFDSSEFETEKVIEEKEDEGDAAKETKDDGKDADKLTPEAAFGKKDEGDTDDAVTDPVATEAATTADDKPTEYTPDLKYKVYDQEKEFPEALKTLVKDKETEETFRTLLAKADGLDEMKPRHQEAIKDRDELRGQVDWYKTDIDRVLKLRDSKPHLFSAEVGITDQWIIDRAKEIVLSSETDEGKRVFDERRKVEYDSYNLHQQQEQRQEQESQSFMTNHQQQMTQALSHPEVSDFQREFDRVHGLGSFQAEVTKHGHYHFESTKKRNGNGIGENLAPMDAVKAVYEFHKKTFASVAPPVVAAAAVKPKVDPIPNVGKGRNSSPTTRKFRTLKELREHADKHSNSNY